MRFVNFSNNNLNLKSDSPAIDAGINLSEFNINDDILGVMRPQGNAFDLGAYEYLQK